jgi:hypothetical protein
MIRKYPRTRHIEGSCPQPGDEGLPLVPFAELDGRHLVVTEKLDGANSGISFDSTGKMLLQSRGHYLTGRAREKQFDLFKQWANCHRARLWEILGDRYIAYGEWMYAKHTIFYDRLTHYFLELDIYDKVDHVFLSTDRRRRLLERLPFCSVPVLYEGRARSLAHLRRLVGPSRYKGETWRKILAEAARARGLDPEQVRDQTDPSDEMEGLYIKVEDVGYVQDRCKYVRPGFRAIIDSEDRWLARPILPNQLAERIDIFRVPNSDARGPGAIEEGVGKS